MVYFSVRLKANLIEFCMHCQSLWLQPDFQKKKRLIYKLCFLSALHCDLIKLCFSKHCEFSFLQ